MCVTLPQRGCRDFIYCQAPCNFDSGTLTNRAKEGPSIVATKHVEGNAWGNVFRNAVPPPPTAVQPASGYHGLLRAHGVAERQPEYERQITEKK
jgi:hypothetical protein